MEEKVAQLEAQAQTASALVAPDSLERQFSALEGDTGVDAELAALKKHQHQHRGGD
jgi:phage shock protein A